MTYGLQRRRLLTAVRRLKCADTAGSPLSCLRLLQKAEATLLAVAGDLRHQISELTGEVLREREGT